MEDKKQAGKNVRKQTKEREKKKEEEVKIIL